MNILQEWNWLKYWLRIKLGGIKDPRGKLTGLLSYDEGLTLVKLAAMIPEGGAIVEIGCYGGLSTAYLLEGAKRTAGAIYSIDPFDTDIGSQKKDLTNIRLADRKPSREQVLRDLAGFGSGRFELIAGYSYEAVKEWKLPIDLLWIDGNHDYQAVRQDYQQWERFIKSGGLIAFHDSNKQDGAEGWTKYGWDGPTRLVREVMKPPHWKNITRVDSITYAQKA